MMPTEAAAGAWVLVLVLWGAVVGGQNITARIGEPLVLSCKGAPKKPPQQLEWKLNTGRTEAWKVLSPQGGPWDSVARILPNGSLLLPAIGIVDEGTFRCRAINKRGKEIKSHYRVRVYEIPGKPEIVDPAPELTAGVPSKVGTCVSEGGYPAGTLSWHLDGKPLIPDGKGIIVKEETRRHPETGLFTLQSELTVTPAPGGAAHPTFSCGFSLGLPRHRPLNTAPIQPRVREPVPPEGIQLLVEPEGGIVAPGGKVTLTCVIPDQPPLQIHWIKDGTPLPLASSPVLLLPEVGHKDEGIYSCVATHPSHGPQESPPVSISTSETGEEGPAAVNRGGVACAGAVSSLCPYRLCGWVWAGNASPGPGDPWRPGNSHPTHWGHPVEKTAIQRRGEEGPRKPAGRGGTRRAQSVRERRRSRERCRRTLAEPRARSHCFLSCAGPTTHV